MMDVATRYVSWSGFCRTEPFMVFSFMVFLLNARLLPCGIELRPSCLVYLAERVYLEGPLRAGATETERR